MTRGDTNWAQLSLEEQAREVGATAAFDATSDAWRRNAWHAIHTLANKGEPFTADHFVAMVGLPNKQAANANNAIGTFFLRAQRKGLIVQTGRRIPSRRSGQHARRQTEWIGHTQRRFVGPQPIAALAHDEVERLGHRLETG